MQGAGKQRLTDVLRQALLAPAARTGGQDIPVSESNQAPVPASTAFGSMAVAQERAAEGAPDAALVEGRRQRAREVLRAMGEVV
ncbi:hypothetical protein CBOM_01757 [Ceraceosorus bombacis]|uniref:Uncharacterized protein n=1 Tax=Ceraceosorus bombacis TaxID=401625 RepID=A0A0P1BDL0_9BASI|nr:hypothetical protein CBOM_01757 [Ceraceosorus bombacis]